jgi:hypothetical protein
MNMRRLIILALLLFVPYFASQEASVPKVEIVAVKTMPIYFPSVYDSIRRWEGNYSNIKEDRGGETYGGITRRSFPDWYGWRFVDGEKQDLGIRYLPRHHRVEKAEMWVKDFYLDIWVKEGFYVIEDKDLAYFLFDTRIHHRFYYRYVNEVLEKMGEKQIELNSSKTGFAQSEWIDESINKIDAKEFVLRLMNRRMKLYYNIVLADRSQMKFLEGWLKRIG